MGLIQRRQAAVMNQHYQRYSLDYFLDAQQRIGFTSIELWCGAQHFWLDDQHYDDVQSLLRKVQRRGLEVVSLTCPSFCFQYQYAPFSPEVADYCLFYFKKGLAVAEDLGCTVMTVNSGWGCMDRPRQESWNALCELLRQLAEEAEQRHITLALESLRQDETDLAYDLPTTRQLIEQVGHPGLKVMADTIATGACGETLEDWFVAFGSDLVHMHFLDGDPFVHNIWGDGNYPLEQMLRCLQANAYTGYLVQEVADERYFADPVAADLQNYRVLSRFFSD